MVTPKHHNKMDTLDKVAKYIIALICIILAFTVLCKLVGYATTNNSKEIILFILGMVSSIISAVMGYYFGSSHSSHKKDEVLGETLGNNNKKR